MSKVKGMPTAESRPARDTPRQDEEKSIAERFAGREPKFDIVRFSAPWRPFEKLTRLLRPRAR